MPAKAGIASDRLTRVRHRHVDVSGIDTFYREAGARDAPVVLLPHGYPCSSFEFRNLMPRLADRRRLLAPDFPGAGYSATPDGYDYGFDGHAAFLDGFVRALGVDRFVLYLHDFGSPIGARLAIMDPSRVAALVIQNGDIPYADALGPKYADIEETWNLPRDAMRDELRKAVTQDGYREEFLNDVRADIAERIPPDLWKLHWSLTTPRRVEAIVDLLAGLKGNRDWFPEHRRYLATHRPPALIVWGPQDHYMPEASARAYLRDLPDAELHLLDAPLAARDQPRRSGRADARFPGARAPVIGQGNGAGRDLVRGCRGSVQDDHRAVAAPCRVIRYSACSFQVLPPSPDDSSRQTKESGPMSLADHRVCPLPKSRVSSTNRSRPTAPPVNVATEPCSGSTKAERHACDFGSNQCRFV